MGCNNSRDNTLALVNINLSFDARRANICKRCQHNISGVCEIIEAKHPGKAVIRNGVRRPGLSCPDGRWGPEAIVCPNCRRKIVIDEHARVCVWCLNKRRIDERNAVRNKQAPIFFDDRDHTILSNAFSDDPVRHLHYFLYPRYAESVDYHIETLRELMPSFNGHTVCCVAEDDKTIDVRTTVSDLFEEVFFVENNPNRRELVGFIPTLERLKPYASGQNDMICFAHGKGQQNSTATSATIREWTDACYETCVANWKEAQQAMEEGYVFSGVFKSVGQFKATPYRWHYSGSFFWGRGSRIYYNPRWNDACNKWWGAESYVGRHFTAAEGHCLFGDQTIGGSLYRSDVWDERMRIELNQWRYKRGIVLA